MGYIDEALACAADGSRDFVSNIHYDSVKRRSCGLRNYVIHFLSQGEYLMNTHQNCILYPVDSTNFLQHTENPLWDNSQYHPKHFHHKCTHPDSPGHNRSDNIHLS